MCINDNKFDAVFFFTGATKPKKSFKYNRRLCCKFSAQVLKKKRISGIRKSQKSVCGNRMKFLFSWFYILLSTQISLKKKKEVKLINN